MKAGTLRRFTAVHTWTGLAAGMGLFIAFYAGAVSVFVHELEAWEEASEGVPVDSPAHAQQLLNRVLAEHPGAADGTRLVLPGDHGPRATVHWYEQSTGQSRRFRLTGDGRLDDSGPGPGATQFVYDLHFTAGLPRAAGSAYLFGVFCVLYGIALVSGVVVYAPNFVKDLFALRLGPNLKRLWQDAHNVIGLLSLPFHVIMAWSGAVLTIGFLMLAPFQLVYEGRLLDILETDLEVAPHVEAAGVRAPLLPVEELVRRARVALPGLEPDSLSLHDAGDANGTATVFGHVDEDVLSANGAVALNAATGEVVRIVSPGTRSFGSDFLSGLQSLHYGQFGGYAVKWLYFVLGLAGAFLFYSGNLLWIESRRRRRHDAQPRRTRLMAALTLGVCLGCVAGVSAVFLAALLASPAQVPETYAAVFFGCLAWACLRRPAHAGHELLWLCAVLTAAIPAAGFINSGEHLFTAIASGHWQRVGIEATALAGAAAFARLAVAARRRGRTGDPHSVWALPADAGDLQADREKNRSRQRGIMG